MNTPSRTSDTFWKVYPTSFLPSEPEQIRNLRRKFPPQVDYLAPTLEAKILIRQDLSFLTDSCRPRGRAAPPALLFFLEHPKQNYTLYILIRLNQGNSVLYKMNTPATLDKAPNALAPSTVMELVLIIRSPPRLRSIE